MLYIILGLIVLCLVAGAACAKLLVLNRELQQENDLFEDENNHLAVMMELMRTVATVDISELKQERDNAYQCLEMVLKESPSTFNDVAVELGLNGVVYQFRNREFYEGMKEITT
jgi:Na+-transporting NADH:ubiquinone oxidoreductase subunit NqrC